MKKELPSMRDLFGVVSADVVWQEWGCGRWPETEAEEVYLDRVLFDVPITVTADTPTIDLAAVVK